MKILFFQHVAFETPRLILDWVNDRGHEYLINHWHLNEVPTNKESFDVLCILGGPMSVYDDIPWLHAEKQFIREAIQNNKIVIGICLGAQLIADVLGANVYPHTHKEIGWFPIKSDVSFLENNMHVFHWHGDTFDLPLHTRLLASSDACKHQAFVYNERVLGIQFHLEMDEAGISDIIEACKEDIHESTFVQSAHMMKNNKEYILHCKEILYDMLDGIEMSLSNEASL